MPKATYSQKLGEEGTAAVLHRCAAHGWIGEHIRTDYGEDLVFQTSFDGEVDPFRIYAQCKSFTARPKSIYLSREHALKWSLMAHLVILFVYVKEDGKLWCIRVNDAIDFYHAWACDDRNIAIEFTNLAKVTGRELRRMEWASRAKGLTFVISNHLSSKQVFEMMRSVEKFPLDQEASLRETEAGLFYLFFRYLGFMEIRGEAYRIRLRGGFANAVERIRRRAKGELSSEKEQLRLQEILAILILARWEGISEGLGLHGLLIEMSSFWLTVFLGSELMKEGIEADVLLKIRL